jgi:DNA-binding transcriptional regulator YiaG
VECVLGRKRDEQRLRGGRDLSPTSFTEALARLGLSQVEAARFFGLTTRIVRMYQRGDSPVPQPLSMLLRLMLAMKLTPAKVKEWLGDND